MNLIKFNRPTPAKSFSNIFDEILTKGFPEILNQEFNFNSPSTNIIENDNGYTIELAIPGVNKDDIDIRVDKDQLIVESKTSSEKTEGDEDANFRRREFNFSSFRRSFYMNDKLDVNKINAKYENGVLVLNIEKREEAKVKEPKKIVVE